MGFLDSLFKGFQNVFGGVGNAVQGAAKTIGGGLTGGAQQLGQGVGKNLTQGVLSAFTPKPVQGMMGNAGRMGMQTGAPQIAKGAFSSMFNQGNHPTFGPANQVPTGGGFNQGVETAPASKGSSFMDMFNPMQKGGQVGLGLLSNLAQFGIKSPRVPDLSQSQAYQNLQNYQGGQLPPNVEAMIQRNNAQLNEQQNRELRNVYKNVRPGTDYTTDSAYQRDLANLQRNQTMNNADALAQASLGFSQQETQRLTQLAQMDIDAIMLQTGLDYSEANSFKEMFGGIGDTLMSSGLGAFDPYKLKLEDQ